MIQFHLVIENTKRSAQSKLLICQSISASLRSSQKSSTAILVAIPTGGKFITASTFDIGMHKLQFGCKFSTNKKCACLGKPKSPTTHWILSLTMSVQDKARKNQLPSFLAHQRYHAQGHASLPNRSTTCKWINTESFTAMADPHQQSTSPQPTPGIGQEHAAGGAVARPRSRNRSPHPTQHQL